MAGEVDDDRTQKDAQSDLTKLVERALDGEGFELCLPDDK